MQYMEVWYFLLHYTLAYANYQSVSDKVDDDLYFYMQKLHVQDKIWLDLGKPTELSH